MSSPFWPASFDVLALALTSVLCLWLALVGQQRRRVVGARTFAWLMLAIVVWTGLSAVHRLPLSLDARVVIAQFQVVGIVAVAPLWHQFGRIQAHRPLTVPIWNVAIWSVPVLVILEVAVHGADGWYWADVRQLTSDPADGVEYVYGPLFWISVSYFYGLVLSGTWFVLRSLRESPPQYRGQVLALALASTIPLAANALYLARVTPDYTPLAFAVSGGIFGWSLFHRYLLNLRPVARSLLFDRFVDPVFVLDVQYRVLDHNAAADTLVGGVVPGAPIATVLPWWNRLLEGDTRQADGPATIRHEGRRAGRTGHPHHRSRRTAGWVAGGGP